MNIFISCQQSTKSHPVPAYQFWETYFKRGIEEAGLNWIENVEVDWAEGLVYSNDDDLIKWRTRAWDQTVDYLTRRSQDGPIDLFLSYLFPRQVDTSAIRAIRALGIPCVNFFCDNVREFVRVPEEFRCFDLHWVPEFKAIEIYQRAGMNFVHAPMPAWIPVEQRTCKHSENYGVTFIGSRDTQREALFARAIRLGVPVEIRGAGWNGDVHTRTVPVSRSFSKTMTNQFEMLQREGVRPWIRKVQRKFQPREAETEFAGHIRPKPNDREYVEITQQSLITLGVNSFPSFRHPFSMPDTYSRLRDIEAPMMGACYLTQWTEGLEDLYELGEEIETYRTAEELQERVSELASSKRKRQQLRYRGQQRALESHNVGNSLTKIRTRL